MADNGRNGRLLFAVGVGLFSVALVAGVIQSLRIDGRLPAIDLLANGSEAYIKLLLARKDYKGAIEQLEMQARIVPDDADTRELLGKLLGDQGHPEEARAHLEALVRLRPGDAEGYCLLGFTYLETNQLDLATRCFTEAIHLDPQFSKAFYGLGFASAKLGDVAEAEKCFAKAVELAPNFTEAQINLKKAREELRGSPDGVKKGKPDPPRD
jgi:tetratricopeptide (TPR) repeat protein